MLTATVANHTIAIIIIWSHWDHTSICAFSTSPAGAYGLYTIYVSLCGDYVRTKWPKPSFILNYCTYWVLWRSLCDRLAATQGRLV